MNIIETIKADQLAARKCGEKTRAAFLTTLISEVSMKGKNDGNRQPTEDDAREVVAKFMKNAKEVVSLNPSASAVSSAECEIDWLEAYLPKQLDQDTLRSHIVEIVAAHGAGCNIGVVMKELKLRYDGQYDGKTASTLAKEVLG